MSLISDVNPSPMIGIYKRILFTYGRVIYNKSRIKLLYCDVSKKYLMWGLKHSVTLAKRVQLGVDGVDTMDKYTYRHTHSTV